jgi:hypothetical protein
VQYGNTRYGTKVDPQIACVCDLAKAKTPPTLSARDGCDGEGKMSSKIVDITCGGIVRLSNGSLYRVHPASLELALAWTSGSAIFVDDTTDSVWPHKLKNVDSGQCVKAAVCSRRYGHRSALV